MLLSELVAFRNRLAELNVSDVATSTESELSIIMHLIQYPLEQPMEQLTEPYLNELSVRHQEIHNAFEKFNQVVSQVKAKIDAQIAEQEKHWFMESYKQFEAAETCETVDHILHNRRSVPSQQTLEAETILRARLSNYADWRYPGIIIRPGLENFIDNMVGYDPLYIVDQKYDLLKPCIAKWPKLYQTRLRAHTTNDWSSDPILAKIPDSQFGLCLAYNVFNYRPLEIIRRYLTEIYSKLRPGGVLLMTFNDCDRASAVMLVERFAASYTPGYLIRDLANSIGFDLIKTWSDGGPSVWLELRKPGELISNRGGQVIALVHHKSGYLEDIDYLKRKKYDDDEIYFLHKRAKELGVDESKIINTPPYELQVIIHDLQNELAEQQRLENERLILEQRMEKARSYGINTDKDDWNDLLKLEETKELAINNGIDVTQLNWQQQLENLLEKLEQERIRQDQLRREERERQRISEWRAIAEENNILLSSPNWQDQVAEIIEKQEEERRRIEEQERKIALEHERQRIEAQKEYARSLGINPDEFTSEIYLVERIAEVLDIQKKEELKLLRQRAMDLEAGDPKLIRYGYSAEKLKELIKAKEEGKQ